MLTQNKACAIAKTCGFEITEPLDPASLRFRQDIRAMCTSELCPTGYGRSWSCPPAVPLVEEFSERAKHYAQGILVQTVGEMEDEFDYESIQNTSLRHAEAFIQLADRLAEETAGRVLPLGAGACSRCENCTYPHNPCRHPDNMLISMEASGLFVTQVCEDNSVNYNHGKNTITYTSCCLF